MENGFVTYHDLIKCGFKQHTARNIIRQTKASMVQKGYALYLNQRLGTVPREAVESIIGSPLNGDVENE